MLQIKPKIIIINDNNEETLLYESFLEELNIDIYKTTGCEYSSRERIRT